MNILEERNYREILSFEFERRQAHNKNYTLRAFARDLSLTPSKLSEVFSKKQGLSKSKAIDISRILGFNAIEADYFSTLVESEHARSKVARGAASLRLQKFRVNNVSKYRNKVFEFVSSWEYLAIIELIQLLHTRSDITWIANKLGLTKRRANECIKKLLDEKLIEKKNNKFIRKDKSFMMWGDDIPSRSIRNFHKGVIQKSLDSMERDSIGKRSFRSTVIQVDPSRMEEANRMIEGFSIELNKFLNNGNSASEVYYFSTQLFPVTKDIN